MVINELEAAREMLELRMQSEKLQNSGDGIDWDRFSELERQLQGKSYGDEVQGYKSSKGLRDQILSGSRLGAARVYGSPTRQWGQPWPSRDPTNAVQERPATAQNIGLKSRLRNQR